MKLAVLVFLATFLTDIIWVLCIRRTAEGKALAASCYSALLIILSALTITSFVESLVYVIPAALGAFVGTYVTLKKEVPSGHYRAYRFTRY